MAKEKIETLKKELYASVTLHYVHYVTSKKTY